MSVPDPLPLRNIDVPPEVTAVDGCDCGGLDYHRTGAPWAGLPACSIWRLPHEQARAAVAAAREREAAFTAELNRKLQIALAGLRSPLRSDS